MLTIEQIRQKMSGLNVRDISNRIGVHENVLYRVMGGANPSYKTFEKLNKYFMEADNE